MRSPQTTGRRRPRFGKTLVAFAVMLPAILGLVGLVIDSGLLMATQRQAQNAADAAAVAAAMDLYRGASGATATATANTFLSNNGISGVTLTLNGGSTNGLNTPPTTGPHAGESAYVEAYVTVPISTTFIQILGVNKSQQVTARAVAGYEPNSSGEGAIVLNPNAVPGIEFKGNNSQLIVQGSVVVNSEGGGFDQFGNTVTTLADGSSPLSGVDAVVTHATPSIIATDIQVVGGVDTLNNFKEYDSAFNPPYDPSNTQSPVHALSPVASDPLLSLPTPNSSNNSAYTTVWANENADPLQPGIYSSITINGSKTFSPGIYVIEGGNLSIRGSGTVTGSGVMFYFTSNGFNAASGLPDSNDGSTVPTGGGAGGGTLVMSGNPTVTFTPISDASSPFYGVLFYQRRLNTASPTLTGNGSSVNVSGTIYAKWAQFQLAGIGTYNAQFIVGSLQLSGNGSVTINGAGKNFGKANLVYLVE
jgi:Flp pilus assembly protein TadG